MAIATTSRPRDEPDEADPMNMRAKPTPTPTESALALAFQAAQDKPGVPQHVAYWRARAFSTFSDLGLPTKHVEAWHYTDLRAALAKPYALVDGDVNVSPEAILQLAPRLDGLAAIRIVLVDGVYVPALSDSAAMPQGVTLRAMDMALASDDVALLTALAAHGLGAGDGPIALNAALMHGGIVLDVAANVDVKTPIEIVALATETREQSFFSRSLVRVGQGARCTLVETHVGKGAVAAQKNDVMIFDVADAATLDHIVTSPRNALGSVQVSTLLANLGAHSKLQSFALVSEAAFLRRQTFLRFNGSHASALLSGVSLLSGREHCDVTLVVEHIAPDCQSREIFKHIVDDAATGVFQGRISVAQGAQKTDGSMSSRAILIGDDAAMYNKPELEIFADDVVCGHGATCGELDEDQVFYAMSRGLPRLVAESLLLEAFAGDVVDKIENEILRDHVMERVRTRLAARSHA